MSVRIKIIPEHKLLVVVYDGDVDFEELASSFQHKVDSDPNNTISRIITDISRAHFRLSHEEFQDYLKLIDPEEAPIGLRWAILADTPVETAYSVLIQRNTKFANTVRTFTPPGRMFKPPRNHHE